MNEKRAKQHGKGMRLTAFVVAFVFTATSVTWNTPASAAPAVAGTVSPNLLPIAQLAIPEELGNIVKTYFPAPDKRLQTADPRKSNSDQKSFGSPVSGLRSPSGEGRMVVLIQDAHAVTDAQENIAKILAHLRKNYGVSLTALEGAKGRLEPILLRTFPAADVKRKILAGYEKRAELSGPEMAAVLQEGSGEYRGMENWGLYEQNYSAYLRAQEKKPVLLNRWNAYKQTLDAERVKAYTPKLTEFHETRENFLAERATLLDLLVYLSEFKGLFGDSPSNAFEVTVPVAKGQSQKIGTVPEKMPIRFQELPGLISSIGYEKSGKPEALASQVRKISDEFKTKYLRGLGVKAEMNFYNRYQAFMTGQITAGQMLQYLVQVGRENGKSVKLTPALKKLLGHAELLSEIKGSRLYDELQRFLLEVEASLIKTPAQRELAAKYQQLYLLKDLINLELTHEQLSEWTKFENRNSKHERNSNDKNSKSTNAEVSNFKNSIFEIISDFGFRDSNLNEILRPALEFYKAALERDQAFYDNIMKMMRQESRDQRPETSDQRLATRDQRLETIAVVAGGFHTKGLERILQEKGVAYAVVTPKIASLAGSENYAKVMQGDVSFKDYLKTTYFDGLMRHASKALVEALPINERVRTLKTWRDNVIRELAKDGRITETGKFLPYIDELLQSNGEAVTAGPKRTKEEILDIVRTELAKFKKDSLAKIWKTFEFQLDTFTDGLKQLIAKKDLSAQSVSTLLDRAGQAKPSFLGIRQVLDPEVRVGGLSPVSTVTENPALTGVKPGFETDTSLHEEEFGSLARKPGSGKVAEPSAPRKEARSETRDLKIDLDLLKAVTATEDPSRTSFMNILEGRELTNIKTGQKFELKRVLPTSRVFSVYRDGKEVPGSSVFIEEGDRDLAIQELLMGEMSAGEDATGWNLLQGFGTTLLFYLGQYSQSRGKDVVLRTVANYALLRAIETYLGPITSYDVERDNKKEGPFLDGDWFRHFDLINVNLFNPLRSFYYRKIQGRFECVPEKLKNLQNDHSIPKDDASRADLSKDVTVTIGPDGKRIAVVDAGGQEPLYQIYLVGSVKNIRIHPSLRLEALERPAAPQIETPAKAREDQVSLPKVFLKAAGWGVVLAVVFIAFHKFGHMAFDLMTNRNAPGHFGFVGTDPYYFLNQVLDLNRFGNFLYDRNLYNAFMCYSGHMLGLPIFVALMYSTFRAVILPRLLRRADLLQIAMWQMMMTVASGFPLLSAISEAISHPQRGDFVDAFRLGGLNPWYMALVFAPVPMAVFLSLQRTKNRSVERSEQREESGTLQIIGTPALVEKLGSVPSGPGKVPAVTRPGSEDRAARQIRVTMKQGLLTGLALATFALIVWGAAVYLTRTTMEKLMRETAILGAPKTYMAYVLHDTVKNMMEFLPKIEEAYRKYAKGNPSPQFVYIEESYSSPYEVLAYIQMHKKRTEWSGIRSLDEYWALPLPKQKEIYDEYIGFLGTPEGIEETMRMSEMTPAMIKALKVRFPGFIWREEKIPFEIWTKISKLQEGPWKRDAAFVLNSLDRPGRSLNAEWYAHLGDTLRKWRSYQRQRDNAFAELLALVRKEFPDAFLASLRGSAHKLNNDLFAKGSEGFQVNELQMPTIEERVYQKFQESEPVDKKDLLAFVLEIRLQGVLTPLLNDLIETYDVFVDGLALALEEKTQPELERILIEGYKAKKSADNEVEKKKEALFAVAGDMVRRTGLQAEPPADAVAAYARAEGEYWRAYLAAESVWLRVGHDHELLSGRVFRRSLNRQRAILTADRDNLLMQLDSTVMITIRMLRQELRQTRAEARFINSGEEIANSHGKSFYGIQNRMVMLGYGHGPAAVYVGQRNTPAGPGQRNVELFLPEDLPRYFWGKREGILRNLAYNFTPKDDQRSIVLADGLSYKGILFDARNPLEKYEGSGWVKESSQALPDGQIVPWEGVPDFKGGMVGPLARKEFFLARRFYRDEDLRGQGIVTRFPVGYGYFPGAVYAFTNARTGSEESVQAGFVIYDETDFRPERETVNHLLASSGKARRAGEALRELQKRGYAHARFHPGNYSLPFWGDPAKSPDEQRTIFVYDFESMRTYFHDLPTPESYLAQAVIDLVYAAEKSGRTSTGVGLVHNMQEFLSGYFGDTGYSDLTRKVGDLLTRLEEIGKPSETRPMDRKDDPVIQWLLENVLPMPSPTPSFGPSMGGPEARAEIRATDSATGGQIAPAARFELRLDGEPAQSGAPERQTLAGRSFRSEMRPQAEKLPEVGGTVFRNPPTESAAESLAPFIGRNPWQGDALLVIQYAPEGAMLAIAYAPARNWLLWGLSHSELARRAGIEQGGRGYASVTLDFKKKNAILVPDMGLSVTGVQQRDQIILTARFVNDILNHFDERPGVWELVVGGGTTVLGLSDSDAATLPGLAAMELSSRSETRVGVEGVRTVVLAPAEQELLGVETMSYWRGVYPDDPSPIIFGLNNRDVLEYARRISRYIQTHAGELETSGELSVLQVGSSSGTATLAALNQLVQLPGLRSMAIDLVDIEPLAIKNTRINLEIFFKEQGFVFSSNAGQITFHKGELNGTVSLFVQDFKEFQSSRRYDFAFFDSPVVDPSLSEEDISDEKAIVIELKNYERIVMGMAEKLSDRGRVLLGGTRDDVSILKRLLPEEYGIKVPRKSVAERAGDSFRLVIEIIRRSETRGLIDEAFLVRTRTVWRNIQHGDATRLTESRVKEAKKEGKADVIDAVFEGSSLDFEKFVAALFGLIDGNEPGETWRGMAHQRKRNVAPWQLAVFVANAREDAELLGDNVTWYGGGQGAILVRYDPATGEGYVAVVDAGEGFPVDENGKLALTLTDDGFVKDYHGSGFGFGRIIGHADVVIISRGQMIEIRRKQRNKKVEMTGPFDYDGSQGADGKNFKGSAVIVRFPSPSDAEPTAQRSESRAEEVKSKEGHLEHRGDWPAERVSAKKREWVATAELTVASNKRGNLIPHRTELKLATPDGRKVGECLVIVHPTTDTINTPLSLAGKKEGYAGKLTIKTEDDFKVSDGKGSGVAKRFYQRISEDGLFSGADYIYDKLKWDNLDLFLKLFYEKEASGSNRDQSLLDAARDIPTGILMVRLGYKPVTVFFNGEPGQEDVTIIWLKQDQDPREVFGENFADRSEARQDAGTDIRSGVRALWPGPEKTSISQRIRKLNPFGRFVIWGAQRSSFLNMFKAVSAAAMLSLAALSAEGAQKPDASTTRIQTELVSIGYLNHADIQGQYGFYGPKTTAAIKKFQAENGLVADGKYGPQTARKLGEVIAAQQGGKRAQSMAEVEDEPGKADADVVSALQELRDLRRDAPEHIFDLLLDSGQRRLSFDAKSELVSQMSFQEVLEKVSVRSGLAVSEFERIAQKYNIPVESLIARGFKENPKFDSSISGPDGRDIGLFQVRIDTVRDGRFFPLLKELAVQQGLLKGAATKATSRSITDTQLKRILRNASINAELSVKIHTTYSQEVARLRTVTVTGAAGIGSQALEVYLSGDYFKKGQAAYNIGVGNFRKILRSVSVSGSSALSASLAKVAKRGQAYAAEIQKFQKVLEATNDVPSTGRNLLAMNVRGRSELREILKTAEDLEKLLQRYQAIYLFIGHGQNNQYRDLEALKQKIAEIADGLDMKWGKGNWLAVYGGDLPNESKPDIGYAMKLLQDRNVSVLAVKSESDRIQPADQNANFTYYYPTKLSPNAKPIRGGIWSGEPEGGTAIYLGNDFLKNGLKGMYALGGGQTALEEFQYAESLAKEHELEINYVPFLARNPTANGGEYGALDQWIQRRSREETRSEMREGEVPPLRLNEDKENEFYAKWSEAVKKSGHRLAQTLIDIATHIRESRKIVSYADFQEQMKRMQEKLRTVLGPTGSYAVVWDEPAEGEFDGQKLHKSRRWAWSQIKDGLREPTVAIYGNELAKVWGIETLVIVDDASYSGTQIRGTIEKIAKFNPNARFVIAVPYMTHRAERIIRSRKGLPKEVSITVLDHEKMPTLAELLTKSERDIFVDNRNVFRKVTIRGKSYDVLQTAATLFEHKIADSWSVYQRIAQFFDPVTPPYKDVASRYYQDEVKEYEKSNKHRQRSEVRHQTVSAKQVSKTIESLRVPRGASVHEIGPGVGDKIQPGSGRIDWANAFYDVGARVTLHEPGAGRLADTDSGVPEASLQSRLFTAKENSADVIIALSVLSQPGVGDQSVLVDEIVNAIKVGGYLVLGYYKDGRAVPEEKARHDQYLNQLHARLGLTVSSRGTDERHHWTIYKVDSKSRSEARVESPKLEAGKSFAVDLLTGRSMAIAPQQWPERAQDIKVGQPFVRNIPSSEGAIQLVPGASDNIVGVVIDPATSTLFIKTDKRSESRDSVGEIRRVADVAILADADWREVFQDNNRPLFVEVGVGDGKKSMEIAKSRQDANFILIEPEAGAFQKLKETAQTEALTNVRILRGEDGDLFNRQKGKGFITLIYCVAPFTGWSYFFSKGPDAPGFRRAMELLKSDGEMLVMPDETLAGDWYDLFGQYPNAKIVPQSSVFPGLNAALERYHQQVLDFKYSDPIVITGRAETRTVTGLLSSVVANDIAQEAQRKGPDAVREDLELKGRAELKRISEAFDAGSADLLSVLQGQSNAASVSETLPEAVAELSGRLGNRARLFFNWASLQSRLSNALVPTAMALESVNPEVANIVPAQMKLLMDTLANIKGSLTIGLDLGAGKDAERGSAVLDQLIKSIGENNKSVNELVVIGRMSGKVRSELRARGVNVRQIQSPRQSVITVNSQAAVPMIFSSDAAKGVINEVFYPIVGDRAHVTDTLINDCRSALELTVAALCADIISRRPELLKQPELLKAEVLKTLFRQEQGVVDNLIQMRPGGRGFTISSVAVKVYLEMMAKQSIDQAA